MKTIWFGINLLYAVSKVFNAWFFPSQDRILGSSAVSQRRSLTPSFNTETAAASCTAG